MAFLSPALSPLLLPFHSSARAARTGRLIGSRDTCRPAPPSPRVISVYAAPARPSPQPPPPPPTGLPRACARAGPATPGPPPLRPKSASTACGPIRESGHRMRVCAFLRHLARAARDRTGGRQQARAFERAIAGGGDTRARMAARLRDALPAGPCPITFVVMQTARAAGRRLRQTSVQRPRRIVVPARPRSMLRTCVTSIHATSWPSTLLVRAGVAVGIQNVKGGEIHSDRRAKIFLDFGSIKQYI
jgi:hypothetical protein